MTQDTIRKHIEDIEGPNGKKMEVNAYSVDRPEARVESRSYAVHDGRVFQKAAVNITISKAHPRDLTKLGADHPKLAATLKEVGELKNGAPLFTASISMVLHPSNVHTPTMHANYRYCKCVRSFARINHSLICFTC
jgi:coproporphyrinogen III oxidase